MIRYLRLFLHFVRFSMSKSLMFRMDFNMRIAMDIVFYAVNIKFFDILFLNTSLLGGWTHAQMRVFVATFLLIDGMQMTLFSNNMWWFPFSVNKGELDYYLVRPVSTLFFVSLRDFAANSFVNFLMGLGIFIWALNQLGEPLEFSRVSFLLILAINGTFIHFLIHFLSISPVFWTHSGRGFAGIFYTVDRYYEMPDRVFQGPLRVILATIVPLSLIASYPARIFLEGFQWSTFLHILGVTLALYGLVLWVWKKGLRAYASASS